MGDTSATPDVLSEQECWKLLRAKEFGRLAYVVDGTPAIVPINYVVDDTELVFRTTDGSKLDSIIADPRVAFEVDDIDDPAEQGSSVVVRGTAHVLDPDEEYRIEQVGLRAWLGHDRPVLVTIRPAEITGRRYPLQRPWRAMRR